MEERELLAEVAEYAGRFLGTLEDRPIQPRANVGELRAAIDGPLPEGPTDALQVTRRLIAAAEPGVVGIPSGRYFGFVIGGELPAALAADWLTALWDQNAGLYVGGPSASVVEEVAIRWLVDLFGLPDGVSAGFVTGAQMAHFVALAAARHHVLERAGCDVAADGLQGAPPIRVLVGEDRHVTIDRALRLLGIGARQIVPVAADDQGRLRPDALADALGEGSGPTIVCAHAGEVNTGSFDPFPAIADAADDAGAWLHVDGAFGLWAAVTDSRRHLLTGVERADSWATDAHKWLNVPYDSGLVFCAHPGPHRAAMGTQASYLVHAEPGAARDQMDWVPEFSRRARGFAVYAALAALGRAGVADLVERSCRHAARFAELLAADDEVRVLNDVVLNQVLVRFGDDDELTRDVVRRVQEDGTCFVSGTMWRGSAAMRISVSNWRTTSDDVARSLEAIRRALAAARSVTLGPDPTQKQHD
jgi:glutamate/tyrosine decarboxylase-like PLP-dependent enzyme